MKKWVRIILIFFVIYVLIGIVLSFIGSFLGILSFNLREIPWVFVWPYVLLFFSMGQYGENLMIGILIFLVFLAFIIWLSYFIDKKLFRKSEAL